MNKPLKIQLTTITPIHIGAERDELFPMEFVHLNGKIYIINQTRLFKELKNKDRLGKLLEEIDTRQEKFELSEFLKKNGLLTGEFLTKDGVTSYSIGNLNNLKPERIRPFIRNAFSQPYIPGTAIKGAIRTAIMWKILDYLKTNNNSWFNKKVTKFINDELDFYEKNKRHLQKGQFKKTFFSRGERDKKGKPGKSGLLELIFQRFLLEGAKEFDPHTDILRALKISDTKPLDKDALEIENVKVLSAGKGLSKPTYPEVIPKDKELTFILTIEENILRDFLEKNRNNPDTIIPFEKIEEMLKDPLGATSEFTKELLKC